MPIRGFKRSFVLIIFYMFFLNACFLTASMWREPRDVQAHDQLATIGRNEVGQVVLQGQRRNYILRPAAGDVLLGDFGSELEIHSARIKIDRKQRFRATMTMESLKTGDNEIRNAWFEDHGFKASGLRLYNKRCSFQARSSSMLDLVVVHIQPEPRSRSRPR